MTLPFSDLTINAVQAAGMTLLRAEPELGTTRDLEPLRENVGVSMAGFMGAANRNAQNTELVLHLLELAAAALIAVEALEGHGRGPVVKQTEGETMTTTKEQRVIDAAQAFTAFWGPQLDGDEPAPEVMPALDHVMGGVERVHLILGPLAREIISAVRAMEAETGPAGPGSSSPP